MVTWLFLLVFFAVAVVAGGLAVRSYTTGEPIGGFFLRPRPERRLAIVETTSVDNRRRLLLVRRDGVEHLIMTGGPVDVVIETGIGATAVSSMPVHAAVKTDSDSAVASTPVFGRQPRTLGQVVNE